MNLFGLFGNNGVKKGTPKGFLVLTAIHNISGEIIYFNLDLDEFDTTLEEERQNLDELLSGARNLIQDANISDRDLLGDFGHNRIRLMDFSSFSIVHNQTSC